MIRLYDRERHRDHAYYFGGHDSRVCAQSFLALSLWALGFPDQAQREAWRASKMPASLGHAFSHAHGLNMGGLTFLLLDDVDACRAVADELFPLAERNKFPWPLAHAQFMRGWLAARDDKATSTALSNKCRRRPSRRLRRLASDLAGLIAGHQIRTGPTMLPRARSTRRRSRQASSPILRVGDHPPARRDFTRAIARQSDAGGNNFSTSHRACGQHACRALKLRAAISLARLLGDRNRKIEAHDLLGPIYRAFTEGFEVPDLLAAKALLAKLN